MTAQTPVPGTTRYFCPLDCDWHYDVPPPDAERILRQGGPIDADAYTFEEAIASLARNAALMEARQTEQAFRVHLDTHDSEQEQQAIREMLAAAKQSAGNP